MYYNMVAKLAIFFIYLSFIVNFSYLTEIIVSKFKNYRKKFCGIIFLSYICDFDNQLINYFYSL